MRTETRKLLFDIAKACRAIQEFNPQNDPEGYSGNPMRRAATERMFEIVGEAMTRLRDFDPATFALISEARAIIGFRNRLIHGYDMVDDAVVWSAIRDKVPTLLSEVERIGNL